MNRQLIRATILLLPWLGLGLLWVTLGRGRKGLSAFLDADGPLEPLLLPQVISTPWIRAIFGSSRSRLEAPGHGSVEGHYAQSVSSHARADRGLRVVFSGGPCRRNLPLLLPHLPPN